jgi:hypothetical protein
MREKSVLDEALRLLGMGLSVIPVNPENKKATVSWKRYQERLPSRAEVKEWWKDNPNLMIGIVTGAVSNLCVIDADDERAVKTFVEKCDKEVYKKIPMVKTPSENSFHFYFQYVNGLTVATDMGVMGGCDLRCEGGYVITAPSINSKGGKYQWIRGHSINDKSPQVMPQDMKDALLVATTSKKEKEMQAAPVRETEGKTYRDGNEWVFDGIVPNGMRDDTMFHLAYRLRNGGMEDNEIESFLTLFSSELCEHTGDDPNPRDKVASVVARSGRASRNIAGEVRRWLDDMKGEESFTYSTLYGDLAISSAEDKDSARAEIKRQLAPNGPLEKVDGRARTFTFLEEDIEFMDLTETTGAASEIWLPFGISDMMNVYDGNIIAVAGEPNSGKSALLLNIVKENMDNFNTVRYLNSEMGPAQLKDRLLKWGDKWPQEDWRFESVSRASRFEKVIKTGEGNLNIIDYMEMVDSFYEINKFLVQLHHKLDGAMLVVALQKDKNAEYGRGASFGLEKPVLYLTLGDSEDGVSSRATIVKCKDWSKTNSNPKNKILNFDIEDGYKFNVLDDWRYPSSD